MSHGVYYLDTSKCKMATACCGIDVGMYVCMELCVHGVMCAWSYVCVELCVCVQVCVHVCNV